MPIVQPAIEILQALKRGLPDLLAANDAVLALLQGVQEGQQVYTLGLRDILNGAGIGAAALAGWQFLASNPNYSVAAQVFSALDDQVPALSSIANDPQIVKAVNAVNAAKALPLFEQPGTELRLLKIPGVLVEAVWLKPSQGDGEIAAYLTIAKSIEAMRWYPAQDFLNLLKPVANEFLLFAAVSAPKATS
jgi:hypothetical protein